MLLGLLGWAVFGGMSMYDNISTDLYKQDSRERAIACGSKVYWDSKGHTYFTDTGEEVITTCEMVNAFTEQQVLKRVYPPCNVVYRYPIEKKKSLWIDNKNEKKWCETQERQGKL